MLENTAHVFIEILKTSPGLQERVEALAFRALRCATGSSFLDLGEAAKDREALDLLHQWLTGNKFLFSQGTLTETESLKKLKDALVEIARSKKIEVFQPISHANPLWRLAPEEKEKRANAEEQAPKLLREMLAKSQESIRNGTLFKKLEDKDFLNAQHFQTLAEQCNRETQPQAPHVISLLADAPSMQKELMGYVQSIAKHRFLRTLEHPHEYDSNLPDPSGEFVTLLGLKPHWMDVLDGIIYQQTDSYLKSLKEEQRQQLMGELKSTRTDLPGCFPSLLPKSLASIVVRAPDPKVQILVEGKVNGMTAEIAQTLMENGKILELLENKMQEKSPFHTLKAPIFAENIRKAASATSLAEKPRLSNYTGRFF